MLRLTRRQFSSQTIGIAAFTAFGLSCGNEKGNAGNHYLDELIVRLNTIAGTAHDLFAYAADVIADAIISRQRCFLRLYDGTTAGTISTDHLPPMFTSLLSVAMAETVRDSNILVTTVADEVVETAKSHGAYIIGIASSSVITDTSGDGQEHAISRLAGISDTIIDTHLPFNDGMVSHHIYSYPILPGSGVIIRTVLGMLAGEAYYRTGALGRTGQTDTPTANGFIDLVTNRISAAAKQRRKISQIVELLVNRVRSGDTISIRILPENSPLATTARTSTGVPMFMQLVDSQIASEDILVINSVSGIKNTWLSSSSNGSLTPFAVIGPDTILSEKLPEHTLLLDTMSPETDGAVTFDHGRRYLSTCGIVAEALVWMLAGNATDRLIDEGIVPPYRANPVALD